MQHDVFISYKSEEFEEADMLRTNLQANGITCWMAPESIPGGSDYATEITQAMEQCRCLVLVMSARAQTSQWIAKEVDLAFRKGKKVLPFMIEKCALAKNFDYYFTNVQYYYAYQNRGKAFRRLVADIRAEIGAPPTKAPVVIPVSAPKKKGMALWGIGGAILGVVLAVAVIALVVGEVGSPLLGIDNPTAQLTTGQSVADTTATQPNGDATSSSATETSTTTTTVAAPSGEAFVVGAASLDATVDLATLPDEQTNLSRQTAVTIPFDVMVGGQLQKDQEYWYAFTTTDAVVYRIAGVRVEESKDYFTQYVTLYNVQGMKQASFEVSYGYVSVEYLDLILEPNTQYYVKVHSSNRVAERKAGYGLFVSPRESDTGLDYENATEIQVGEQYTFTLNSTVSDWLLFVPEEGCTYDVTIYNVDVGGKIVMTGYKDVNYRMGSAYVTNGDSGKVRVYNADGKPLRWQISPGAGEDNPNGTYIIVIEKTA